LSLVVDLVKTYLYAYSASRGELGMLASP
jgi:hypothetical protein